MLTWHPNCSSSHSEKDTTSRQWRHASPKGSNNVYHVSSTCTPRRRCHKLHMTTTSSKPRSTVDIDIAPDFPPDRGHHHIIIFVDFASNFVTIKPLKTKTSKEILEKFLEHVATFGIPHIVRHDNEKGITDGEFKKFCETNMIEQVTGLPNKGQTTYLVRVAPDCNRSYCEDSFSGYSGSV